METLVGMNECVFEDVCCKNGVILHGFHSIEHQVHLQTHGEVPGHDLTTGKIFHDRQISKSVVEWNISDISGKEFKGDGDVEDTIQYIFTCAVFQRFLHDHFIRVMPSNLGDEMILGFDASDLFVIHNNPFFQEFHLNCPPTVFGFPLAEYLIDPSIIVMVFVWSICLF